MNNLDLDYQNLLQDILDNGVTKETRNGGTISVFGRQIRHKMSEGFPLLTTKKVHFKSVIAELFIERIKTDDDFAQKWGDLGPIYGKQWKSWNKYDHQIIDKNSLPNVKSRVDQIQNLIKDLRTNPDSRRLMVNAWNVGELDQMVLPPCHYGFQVYTRELTQSEHLEFLQNNPESWGDLDNNPIPQRKISLMWNQRSVDTFLGLPFNIASYGLLLQIIAKEVNMIPDELIGNLGDTHLYSNHIEQAKEQISREPYPLPTFKLQHIEKDYTGMVYELENYESHPTIKAPLSN